MTITIEQYLENAQKKAKYSGYYKTEAEKNKALANIQSISDAAKYHAVADFNTMGEIVNAFVSDYLEKGYDALKKKHGTDEKIFANMLSEYVKIKAMCEAYFKKKGMKTFRKGVETLKDELLPGGSVACYTLLKFEDALEGIDIRSKNAGKVFLNRAKNAYEQAQMEVRSEEIFKGRDNYAKFRDCATLSNLIKAMNGGDEMLRGSSKEYKEIKRDIKALNDYVRDDNITRGDERSETIHLWMETIMEKAKRYIKSHRKVAESYAEDSYKGKRVAIMKEVLATLDAKCKDHIDKNKEYYFGGYWVELTAEKIASDFSKEKFSANKLAKAITCDLVQNGKIKHLAFEKLSDRVSEVYKENHLELMEQALKGRKVDLDAAKNMLAGANEYLRKVKENIAQKSLGELKTYSAKLKDNYDKRFGDTVGIEVFDHMIFEEDPSKTITGDGSYDREIMKFARKMVKNAIEEKTIEVEMKKEAEAAPALN